MGKLRVLKFQLGFLLGTSLLFGQPKAAPAKQPQGSYDWFIVPGVRVGPLTEKTSRQDLSRIFGAASVTDREVDVGEGMSLPATVVYPKDPTRRLEIFWESENQTRRVRVCGANSKTCLWHTISGISLGTNLRRLEQINGHTFTMAGFGWDYSGTVYSWDGGTLDTKGLGRLILRLDPPREAEAALSSEQLLSVTGERDLLSSNAVLQKLNPTVYQILFDFPDKRQK